MKHLKICLISGAILIVAIIAFSIPRTDRAAALQTEILAKQQEYARIAGEKIEYERSCAIAREKSEQLLLLHGQAERLRAERMLVLAQMGKGEGAL